MACVKCLLNMNPGKTILVDDEGRCISCGEQITSTINDTESTKYVKRWDTYFHSICIAIASKSPCLSRKIGAILVRDKSIIATGYNGPPRGVPHCGHDRTTKDRILLKAFTIRKIEIGFVGDPGEVCPRRLLGYKSGEGLEWCPAQHVESNCISNAARLGVSTLGSTLYMNCVISCKDCFGKLINAGIVEIVVDEAKVYDKHTQYLIDNSDIKIREFKL